MKKLKKGLSLLLVLAMVFSLASTAFAAWDTEYKDDDQITQREAVAVMTGMGIIEGDETTGLFDPAGQFTREAAAKIITYMSIGADAAETLTSSKAVFSDVATTRWSAPYIAYAQSQKIIEGYGDGTFGPSNDLTRAAWLKMLLVSLGVDPDKNGLGDDANWDINAQAMAVKAGLVTADELKLDWNRETAVLYAFKAMQKAQDTNWTKQLVNADDTSTKTVRQYVPYLYEDNTSTDEFGRPITKWTDQKQDGTASTSNGKITTYAESADDAVAVYTDAVKFDDLKKDLELVSSATKITAASVVIDGEEQVDGTDVESIDIGDAWLTDYTGKSTQVEIYKDGPKYTVVVINTYVYKITEKIDANAKTVELTSLNPVTDAEAEPATTAVTAVASAAGLAKGDVVVFNKGAMDAKGISAYNVTVVEGVEGKVTAVASDYVRVDGEVKYSAKYIANSEKIANGATATFYYDSFGNIIYVANAKPVAAQAPDGYVYNLGGASQKYAASESLLTPNTEAKAVAQVIDLATGEVSVINQAFTYNAKTQKYVYVDKDGKVTTTEVGESDTAKTAAGYYAYYKLDDGTYVLNAVDEIDSADDINGLAFQDVLAVDIAKGSSVSGIAGVYATNSTKLTVVNAAEEEGKYEVSTFTGINNFPTVEDDAAHFVLVLKDEKSNKANEIIVVATTQIEDLAGTATVNYAIYLGRGEEDAETHDVGYKFLVNGEEVTVVSSGEDNDELETYTDVETTYVVDLKLKADGTLDSASRITENTESGEVVALTDSYIYVESQIGLADGYEVVVTDKDNPEAELAEKATVTVYYETVQGQNVTRFIVLSLAAPEED